MKHNRSKQSRSVFANTRRRTSSAAIRFHSLAASLLPFNPGGTGGAFSSASGWSFFANSRAFALRSYICFDPRAIITLSGSGRLPRFATIATSFVGRVSINILIRSIGVYQRKVADLKHGRPSKHLKSRSFGGILAVFNREISKRVVFDLRSRPTSQQVAWAGQNRYNDTAAQQKSDKL